jgi:hypothetical protein
MARQSDSKRIKVRSNLPKAQVPVGLAEIVFLTLSEVFDWMWLQPVWGSKCRLEYYASVHKGEYAMNARERIR